VKSEKKKSYKALLRMLYEPASYMSSGPSPAATMYEPGGQYYAGPPSGVGGGGYGMPSNGHMYTGGPQMYTGGPQVPTGGYNGGYRNGGYSSSNWSQTQRFPPVPGGGKPISKPPPAPRFQPDVMPSYGGKKYAAPANQQRVFNPMTGRYFYPNKPQPTKKPVPPTGAYYNQTPYSYANIPGLGANAIEGDGWAYAPL
jgi:hypothetical protein